MRGRGLWTSLVGWNGLVALIGSDTLDRLDLNDRLSGLFRPLFVVLDDCYRGTDSPNEKGNCCKYA